MSLDGEPAIDFTLPPNRLMARVAGSSDPEWFRESGEISASEIRNAISKATPRPLESFERILDFGCGCGRILFAMEKVLDASKLYGVDIDAEQIKWLNKNAPRFQASVNRSLPPLDLADGYFDLVYCHSVFTHIDEAYQDAWLSELHRVTSPGAVLVLSVHGEFAWNQHLQAWAGQGLDTSAMRRELEENGILYTKSDRWGEVFPDFYHTACHAPWYIHKHWGRYFKVHAQIEQGSLNFQDFVVLERTTAAAPAAPLPVSRKGSDKWPNRVQRLCAKLTRYAKRVFGHAA